MVKLCLTKAFLITNNELKSGKINALFSGTTVNIVFILKEKYFCANSGDSRSVMVKHK